MTITVGQMARHSHDLDLSLASGGGHNHKVGETFDTNSNDSLNDVRYLTGRRDRLPHDTATLGSATDAAHVHTISGTSAVAGSASPTPITITSKSVVMVHIIKT